MTVKQMMDSIRFDAEAWVIGYIYRDMSPEELEERTAELYETFYIGYAADFEKRELYILREGEAIDREVTTIDTATDRDALPLVVLIAD